MFCDLFQHAWNQCYGILVRQATIDGRELLIVSRPVIGWQAHPDQQYPGMLLLAMRNYAGKAGLGVREGQPAQAVIAAERNNYDCGFACSALTIRPKPVREVSPLMLALMTR